MLKVRTVTTGVCLAAGGGVDEWARVLGELHGFNETAKAAYEAAGYEVQTLRLATNPFEEYVDCSDRAAAVATFALLDGALARQRGARCRLDVGPAQPRARVAEQLAPRLRVLDDHHVLRHQPHRLPRHR